MENYQYAGFWLRLGAFLIDGLIILILTAAPLTLIYGTEYWLAERAIYGMWDVILNYIFPLVAIVWFWRRYLATPGKMALRLKVVDARTGEKLTMGQSIGRYFAYILSTIPFFLGFIWIAVDSKKQGFHDKLAGTVVVRDNRPVPVEFEQAH